MTDSDRELAERLARLAGAVPVSSRSLDPVQGHAVVARRSVRVAWLTPLVALVLVVVVANLAQIGPFGPGATGTPGATQTGSASPEEEPGLSSIDEDGSFALELRAGEARYGSDEAIDVIASLTYSGPEESVRFRHNKFAAPIMFGIREKVFGEIQLEPVIPSCICEATTTLERDAPLVQPFGKIGGIPGGHPDAAMFRAWLEDPVLRLPAGTWHLYAESYGYAGENGVEGWTFDLDVEIEIRVDDGPSATPEGSYEIPLATLPAANEFCAEALGGGRLAVNELTGLGVELGELGEPPSQTVAVTWPYGWSARYEGALAVLVDPSGRIVAREGDWIITAGGWSDGDTRFTSCGVDPWAGTPLEIATAPDASSGCRLRENHGMLFRDPMTGLGITISRRIAVSPVIWPSGYSAREINGIAVLFDPTDNVVGWEGATVSFAGPEGPDGSILACGEIERLASVFVVD